MGNRVIENRVRRGMPITHFCNAENTKSNTVLGKSIIMTTFHRVDMKPAYLHILVIETMINNWDRIWIISRCCGLLGLVPHNGLKMKK